MIRVAFLVGPFPVPSKTFLIDQITGLIDRGLEVDIFAIRPEETTRLHGDFVRYNLKNRLNYYPSSRIRSPFLRVLNLPKIILSYMYSDSTSLSDLFDLLKYGAKARSLRLFSEVAVFLRKKNYDIIHAHFGPYGLYAKWLCDIKALKGKLVTSFHGFDVSKYLKQHGNNVYESLFTEGDLFLPVSDFWKERLVELGCNSGKIRVHHMGVDCDLFRFRQKPIDQDRPFQVLSVARLTEKKGIEFGIGAVGHLLKKKLRITYEIVGDGPLREVLRKLIEDLGVENEVRLLGWKNREETARILHGCDVLICPSVTSSDGNMEGIPMVLMEAMASGVPVISTKHSGIPELIEDGRTGFLVPERSSKGLAQKIEAMICTPKLIPGLATSARERVELSFNVKKQNDKLVQHYNRLLAQSEIKG